MNTLPTCAADLPLRDQHVVGGFSESLNDTVHHYRLFDHLRFLTVL